MTDREKVIKELEECLSASCRGFRTCPYSDADWDAVREALALLREQEPVRPRWIHPEVGTNLLMCGGCGIAIPFGKPYYCPWCGKEVKWDD